MTQVIYSAQRVGFVKGRNYQNPRFFEGKALDGVTDVVIVGDWPRVKAAYESEKIPVRVVSDPKEAVRGNDDVKTGEQERQKTQSNPAIGREPTVPDDRGKRAPKIAVPEDYEELSYRELKKWATEAFPEQHFKGKADIIEAIKGIDD